MPELTGFDLARDILVRFPDMPIILCSGYSETVSAEMARAVGIKEYITKPFNKSELARNVRRVLEVKTVSSR